MVSISCWFRSSGPDTKKAVASCEKKTPARKLRFWFSPLSRRRLFVPPQRNYRLDR